MAEKVAAQSFVKDVGKYASVSLADSFGKDGGGTASVAAQMAIGMQMANQMMGSMGGQAQATPQTAAPAHQTNPTADRFCPKCRKMVSSNFCPECGTQTV